MTDQPEYPGAPRWVKVAAAIIVVLILILLALLVLGGPGGHGPGQHLSLKPGAVPVAGFGGG